MDHIIAVNGTMYSFAAITGNTSETIRDGLFTAIDGSASASVTVVKVEDHGIRLISKSLGRPFGINLGGIPAFGQFNQALGQLGAVQGLVSQAQGFVSNVRSVFGGFF